MMSKFLILFVVVLSLFFISCSTTVGDSCEQESDCDAGLICETNFPDGYCLKARCDIYDSESCTDNSQCTYFEEVETTYCLEKCNTNDDCRSKYTCQAVSNNEYRVCLPE
jgi:hypothetical protein